MIFLERGSLANRACAALEEKDGGGWKPVRRIETERKTFYPTQILVKNMRMEFVKHNGEVLLCVESRLVSAQVSMVIDECDRSVMMKGRRIASRRNNGRGLISSRCVGRQKKVKKHISQRLKQECGQVQLEESLEQLDRQGIASLLQGRITLAEGRHVHAHINKRGLRRDRFLANLLVNMYGRWGVVVEARSVFDKMQQRDVVSWNVMITAYAQNGHGKEACQLFRQMQQQGVKPNKITFISVLGACVSPVALADGEVIHACITASGYESDLVVGTALVNMYSKCGSLEDACSVFGELQQRDVVSWTAMIAAYVEHGHAREALEIFQQMQQEGVKPNKITFINVLGACASQEALPEGEVIHACIVDCGVEVDINLGNALANMYGRCGALENARLVFDKMHQRDVVSWNAMIAAYAQHGQGKVALQFFRKMKQEAITPDKITFISVLGACASLAALAEGKVIHACIVASGFEVDVMVGTALVNMYSKCGSLEDARPVFDKMPQHNVVSWNAIIDAYGQHGLGREALHLFRQMQLEGVKADKLTFMSLLSACSHAGLLDEGCYCFVSMSEDYGITPALEHYSCMVDLFGRAGQLHKAEDFIYKMPFQPDASVWMILLGACRIHGDVERAKCAAKHVIDLDLQKTQNGSPYVLLSNIYASYGRWDDVLKVRKTMAEQGIKKQPGCSLIEVDNRVYQFFVRDTSHPETEAIYAELARLSGQMQEVGYVPDTKLVLHDVEEEQKEHLLCYHSEKLAIVFGMITTSPGTTLRVINNLRVCSDCHTATKFITKIVGREIIVRDTNHVHHFKREVCSCGDYW